MRKKKEKGTPYLESVNPETGEKFSLIQEIRNKKYEIRPLFKKITKDKRR